MTASAGTEQALSVLVVDDEEDLVRTCARILEHEGYRVVRATRGRAALDVLRRQKLDILLTDVMLPDVDGMTLLREAKRLDPDSLVVMITGNASVESSIEAIRAGAYDYLPKPFTATQLQVLLGRAAQQVRLARENERLRQELRERYSLDNVIGVSEPMQRLFERVLKVASTEASIFIRGESGAGKELIARAIHVQSRRAERPFVAVNCAAFPDNLLESELFGHEKGAFTGADAQKRGLLEYASGGTFFLDEICEMSQELQAKLLRALQERRIRRVGAEAEVPVDIRVIAATNRDPEAAVETGVLRRDLYFRLNVIPITVPPLRERRDDIPLLARMFLRQYAERYDRDAGSPLRLSAEAMSLLVRYDWPGNVRELQNLMERVVSLAAPGQEIAPADLPPELAGGAREPAALPDVDIERPFRESKEAVVESFERAYLRALLDRHGGNISRAARDAGMDRKTIHRLLRKLGLQQAADAASAGDAAD